MAGRMSGKGLLVLDRDGVINKESRDFVKSADEWVALPGSVGAIAALSKEGYIVTVASNQSGLARGLFNNDALVSMHEKLHSLVTADGGRIDRIVVCPHGPDDGCDCRKPKPGLLLQLGEHYNVPLTGVPVIGDSLRDLEAALAVRARPILVRSGNGRKTERRLTRELAHVEVFDDLAAAASALLSE